MLIAALTKEDGRRLLVLGLMDGNVTRLVNDQPILKNLGDGGEGIVGLEEWDVTILGPEDIQRWMDAPAGTISALPPSGVVERALAEPGAGLGAEPSSASAEASEPESYPHHCTLGQLRELTYDMPDVTPIAVVTRKAHDSDYFYEPVFAESGPHIDLNGAPQIILTAPEPDDFDA